MAWVNCTECGVTMQTCCGRWNICSNCKSKKQQELRKQMNERIIESQKNAEHKDPINIADLDNQFCRCCWIPKNWCICECRHN